MPFPRVEEIEVPLLLEIEAMGGEARPKEIYLKVASHFPQITEEDLKSKVRNTEVEETGSMGKTTFG